MGFRLVYKGKNVTLDVTSGQHLNIKVSPLESYKSVYGVVSYFFELLVGNLGSKHWPLYSGRQKSGSWVLT